MRRALCAAFSAVCAVLPADSIKASIETSLFTTWAGYALMVARIGAGFGGGGIYTLAAALESRRHTPVAVGLASTGVVLGQVVLYLVGWLLLLVLGLDDTGPQWRCIFAFGSLMAFLAKRHCGRGPKACPGPPAAARCIATPAGRVTCRLPIVIAPALRCLREARSRGFVAAPLCIRGADSPQLVDLVCRTRRRTLCCAN